MSLGEDKTVGRVSDSVSRLASELRRYWESAGGQIPSDWSIVPLESLLRDSKSIAVGVMYPGPDTPSGIPLIKVGDIKDGSIPLKPTYCVSEKTNEEHKRTQLVGDELLITLVGNPGECVVVKPSMAGWNPARAIAVIRLHDPSIRIYLKTVLESAASRHLIDAVLNTTVQKTLNLKDIRKLPIPMPPSNTIKNISAIADVLTNRIALLRETNATLEAIAQALFKSWFVDFDLVHAKQQGREPEGMDADTAALFPDGFEESELGLVPRGWRIGNLANLAKLNPESWKANKHPDTVAYIDLANTKDNEIAAIIDYQFDEAPSRARRSLSNGDTIIGTVRPGNRSFAFIHGATSNLTASTGFAVLRPKTSQNTEFVYLAATQDSSIEYLAHVADGGAYPAVRPEVVSGIQCVLPSNEIMQAFHGITSELLISIVENQQQAQTLTSLRDTLLPRLISGHLRLPDAEEAAA
ncbi:restriction endonuclease subunit S [Methylovulum psychrotolerans]|uniref:Restriction endonuclease subunit S n=1 Tax=Methylovulum psychrotolerans TaxID=1704499 RepID=A0A2S5CRS3_9GAMM|nr:restriction endonuclease subunit S [Methylovulum psychrotolerans]POZ53505.1 restriction endonuclease subunit S [Methylovulum psychrotolerans]